jgi:hypothetical protein
MNFALPGKSRIHKERAILCVRCAEPHFGHDWLSAAPGIWTGLFFMINPLQ